MAPSQHHPLAPPATQLWDWALQTWAGCLLLLRLLRGNPWPAACTAAMLSPHRDAQPPPPLCDGLQTLSQASARTFGVPQVGWQRDRQALVMLKSKKPQDGQST